MPNDPDDFIERYERDKAADEATERARARASRPRSGLDEPVRRKYARQALERESELLAGTNKGQRNWQLNVSAMKLAQMVATGYLDQSDVDEALESACRTNGMISDDGIKSFEKTLASGTRKGLSEPRDLSEVGLKGFQEYSAEPARPRPKIDQVQEIEDGFWDSRDSLRNIYLAAMAGMASPWAVLGCCAAKALALCPPDVRLPDIIGGPGSLNWFVALAAVSGGGKGAAMQVTERLIKSTVLQKNIGSGEGMIEAYRKPRDKETGEPGGQHQSIMFVADEIDTLAAHQSRSGATILPTLRSSFNGVTLGASTKASSGFHLESHSYRMTLIVGAQPSRASAILDDAYGGTPQRFMWFPATDSRVSADIPAFPSELELPNTIAGAPTYSDIWAYGAELVIPEVARMAIIRARVKSQRGEGDPLDSHKLFCQEKFAYALAILDGRDEMELEDWKLAGVAMKVSDYTREWVQEGQEDAIREDAEKHGRVTGYAAAAAEQSKQVSQQETVNRVAGRLLAFIKANEKGVTQSELNRKLTSRDRGLLIPALNLLENSDLAMTLDRKWMAFDARAKEDFNDEDF